MLKGRGRKNVAALFVKGDFGVKNCKNAERLAHAMLFASCTVSRGKDTADGGESAVADERAGLKNELYKASYKIWFETLEDADAGTFIGGNDK